MKLRAALVTAIAGGLLVSVSGAEAASTPVLDGKKVKVLTKTMTGGTQQHVAGVDAEMCEEPECMLLPFVYAPAKGVKGGLMFTVTWKNPSDLDLSVVEVDPKRKTETVVASCGTSPSMKESVYLSPKELRPGRTYRLVVHFWLAVQETVTGKVEINVPSRVATTVPQQVNDERDVNCLL